jgi:hypothetical protein
MHVHSVGYSAATKAFSQLIAIGVVGERDMAAPLYEVLRLRQETGDRSTLGPHMIVAGPMLVGPIPPKLAAVRAAAARYIRK